MGTRNENVDKETTQGRSLVFRNALDRQTDRQTELG